MSNTTSTFRLRAELNLGVEDREDLEIDDEVLAKALRRALTRSGEADRTFTITVLDNHDEEREVSVHFEIPSTAPWEDQ